MNSGPAAVTIPARSDLEPVEPLDELANELYTHYCASVGGKAFNGDSLPDWETFKADPKKQPQVKAWLSVARRAFLRISETVLSKKVILINVGNKNPAEVVQIVNLWREFLKTIVTDSGSE